MKSLSFMYSKDNGDSYIQQLFTYRIKLSRYIKIYSYIIIIILIVTTTADQFVEKEGDVKKEKYPERNPVYWIINDSANHHFIFYFTERKHYYYFL